MAERTGRFGDGAMMYSRVRMMAPAVLAGAILSARRAGAPTIDGKWQGSHAGPGGVVRVLFDLRTDGAITADWTRCNGSR